MTDPASQHPYMYCRGNPVNYADPSGYDRIYIGRYSGAGPKIDKFEEIKKKYEKKGHTVKVVPSPDVIQIVDALLDYDLVFLMIHGNVIDKKAIAGDQKGGTRFSPKSLNKELKGRKKKAMRAKVVGFLGCYTKNVGWEEVFNGSLPPVYIGAEGPYWNATSHKFIDSFLDKYFGESDRKPGSSFMRVESEFRGRLRISP